MFDDFPNPVNMDMSGYFMNSCSLFGDGETHSCHHEFSRAFPGELFQYICQLGMLWGIWCSNAKQGPHTAYNAYKEFVIKDTTALFLAAAMEHFGLQDLTEHPESFIPENIVDESPDVKRTWLHEATAKVTDQFVMLSDIPETARGVSKASATPIPKKQFPCRMEGCMQIYIYLKARETHEKNKHNLVLPSESMPKTSTPTQCDHIKEHTMARLGFGFLLLNVLDAIKEGDGGRLMRLYQVALLFYKAYGHTHYAYSTFLLTLQVNATLSPCMAHSVTWNRFWNGQGGKGRNIPLDLHLEHLNNFLKSFLKGLGANLNEQSAARISQFIGVLREMVDNTDLELKVTRQTGTHRVHEQSGDVVALVAIFREAELFKEQTGREFSAFPGFTKNLLERLDYGELWRWMRGKKSKTGEVWQSEN
ncbi:uncharacterized protein LOC116063697 [Sander lucioperca]|uniref:uncharacterized protein LOC116063697 n=1 Tax=Sander lucioperca TaxID=283035 RepID=UPI00125D6445|nr:uncharacterized protein LOC116063697 [Sander lucioperca]